MSYDIMENLKVKKCVICKKQVSSAIHVEALDKHSYLYHFVSSLPQPENEYVSFKWMCFNPCYGQYSLDNDIQEAKRYEELEAIKNSIDNNKEMDDNSKQFLYQLINQKQEELNHTFIEKLS